jgi:hypothetical protein
VFTVIDPEIQTYSSQALRKKCLSTVSPPEFLKQIRRKPETTVFYPALSLIAAVPPVPSLKLHLYQLHRREIGTQISGTIQYFGFHNHIAPEKPENNTTRPTGHESKKDVVELLHLLSLLSLVCFKLQALQALHFYQ